MYHTNGRHALNGRQTCVEDEKFQKREVANFGAGSGRRLPILRAVLPTVLLRTTVGLG